MTNEIAPARAGALTGGLIGAASRPAIVAIFWLVGDHKSTTWQVSLALLMASSLIGLIVGLLVGWVACTIRHPVVSLLVGACLGAALAFVSSLVTMCFLCGITDGRNTALVNYWLAMSLAGALAGVGGGLAGGWMRRKQAVDRVSNQGQARTDTEAEEDESPGLLE